MLATLTNPIVTHGFCLVLGAALSWYATHKTAAKAAAASVESAVKTVLTDVKS